MSASDIIRDVYSVSAIGVWFGLFVLLLKYGRPGLTIIVDLTKAITRASIAMESTATDAGLTREATVRIESACARIETIAQEVRTMLATHSGRVEGRSESSHAGEREPKGKTK